MKTPAEFRSLENFEEIQAIADAAGCDFVEAWLANARAKNSGHDKVMARARAEKNRRIRQSMPSGMALPPADGLNAFDPRDAVDCLDEEKNRGGRQKKWDLSGTEDPEEHERQIQELLALAKDHGVKPRDRLLLKLRFEDGQNFGEIAAAIGKTPQAVYAGIERLKKTLQEVKSRRDWERKNLVRGTGDAPVFLGKNQQLGWDLGGAA